MCDKSNVWDTKSKLKNTKSKLKNTKSKLGAATSELLNNKLCKKCCLSMNILISVMVNFSFLGQNGLWAFPSPG